MTPTLTLSLTMEVNPASVNPGELVTVTLTLSNPGQIPVENLTISSTLPAGLSYDAPLGPVVPGYNPLLQLLTWPIPADLSSQAVLVLGYVGRVAVTPPASLLSLAAEISQPSVTGLAQAQTSLVILAAPTPTPTATPFPVGPPATTQLGVEAGPGEREGDQRKRWLTVYVLDADGLAVADDTEVQLSSQGGTLAETRLRTRNGVATTGYSPGRVMLLLSAPRPVRPRAACKWDRAPGRRRCWPAWDWVGRGTDGSPLWPRPATPCGMRAAIG